MPYAYPKELKMSAASCGLNAGSRALYTGREFLQSAGAVTVITLPLLCR